jgi:SSS family solute:Na+ symporter
MNMDYWAIGSLIIFFIVMLLISLYKSNNESKLDFFLGGRRTAYWMLGMSFVATWYGGSSAIISTNKAFKEGMSSWWILGGTSVIAVIFLMFFSRLVRQTGAVSQSEIVKRRYSRPVGNMLVIVLIVWLCTWSASQMVILGQFIGPFIGTDYATAVLLCVLVALIYTTLGGFSAVVLTEMVQFILLVVGLAVTMVVAMIYSGGLDHVNAIVHSQGKVGYYNIFHDFGNNLTYIISFCTAFAIDAAIWQRLSAARSPKDAQKACLQALLYFIPLYFMVVATGIAALGVFGELPEEGVVPALLGNYMGPVLRSIVFLGIASAVMSTCCTALNACSLYITELYEEIRRQPLTERHLVIFGRVATVLTAMVGILIALRIQDALAVLTLANQILAAGAFAPIVGGFFWKRATSTGAMMSIVLGGGFEIYNFLADLGLSLPRFWHSSVWAIIIGLAIGIIAFIVGSLLSRADESGMTRLREGGEAIV